ncbi:solute carrier family 46 member 3-like [Elysia marginata]|uniref:Solute carrier family 46 member 3-like n=1 Tax=Elysia marginata TaxID=1093978 RepID=A0AAV4GEI9_9GAST|nr:solute carrier family 46 member 3-like [Elysia marginata]
MEDEIGSNAILNSPPDRQRLIEFPPLDEEEDIEEDSQKRRNMLTMIVACSFVALGYGIHGATYSQWIYVRFEMDALGDNFSKLNESASKDPCFRGNHSDSPFSSQLTEAQTRTAHFSVLTTLCSLIPSIFVNLLFGACADQIGRRLIFIVPLAGNLVHAAIVWAVAYWQLDVNLVLIAYTVNGVTGEFVAFLMAVSLYTADNTTEGKDRSFLMVVAQAVITTSYFLCHLATGYFIEALGYAWPLVTSLAVLSIGFLLIVFFLQETLDRSKVERVSLLRGIRRVFSFYFQQPTNPTHKRKDALLLVVIFFVYAICYGDNIDTIFLMNEPFCWGSRRIGYVKSGFGLAHSLLPVFVMKLLQVVLSDELLCIICLLSATVERSFLAFSSHDWQIYTSYAAGFLDSAALPIIRAVLSRMYHAEKRGPLFASLAVIETVTLAVSGVGLSELYAGTVASWRGLTYFVLGCVSSFSAVLMLIYSLMVSRRQPRHTASEGSRNVNTFPSDRDEIG